MAGYIASKAVVLSTTGSEINGDSSVTGALTVGGAAAVGGALTVTGSVVAASGNFNTLVGGRAVVGGTGNAITLTTGLNLPALVSGMQIRFRTGGGNTGATTINVDGLGAVTAVTVTSAALPDGYIRSNIDTVITYNAPDWIVSREVESGSSSNGIWTKWENGTMIAASQLQVQVNYNVGNVSAVDGNWFYPVLFAAAPRIQLNVAAAGTGTSLVTLGTVELASASGTSARFRVWRQSSVGAFASGSFAQMNGTAVGDWY